MKHYDDLIDIRSIQHYCYCPHRFGLIENDCSFQENVFVVKGNMVHERVDSGKNFQTRNVLHENSVRVYNDEWGLFGVLDCLEFRKDENGVYVKKFNDTYNLTIVEYKVTAPKKDPYRYEDMLQVLAQKICVDEIFNAECQVYFYYANTKKRVKVDFEREHYEDLHGVLENIRSCKKLITIPEIKPKQKCSGCSMIDICLPPKKGK